MPLTLRANDSLGLRTHAELLIFRERHQREAYTRWDDAAHMREIGRRHWNALAERDRPIVSDWEAYGRLIVTRRAMAHNIIAPVRQTEGSNKVLLQGIVKLIDVWRVGGTYNFTHLDMGTSTAATTEGMTGAQAHVDASAGVTRATITEKLRDSKTLKTSTFLNSAEYNGVTLAEGLLCDAISGATPYNRVLFSTPLAKTPSDTAIAGIDHAVANP